MSKYTTQIRYVVEMYSDPHSPMSKRIEEATHAIFNFDYPIWSLEYKKILEKKILMHYFNKEICFETLGLWKLYLEERLNLIMPYYNEIYTTVSNKYDWLEDVNLTETYVGDKNTKTNLSEQFKGMFDEDTKSDSNTTANDTATTHAKSETKDEGVDTTSSELHENKNQTATKKTNNLTSDTPQANFQGLDYATQLVENNADDTSDSTNDSNSESRMDRNNTTNSTSDTTNSTDRQEYVNATGNRIGNTQNNTNAETASNTNDIFTRVTKGLNGSRSKTTLNMEYRNSLINIDKMIIEELQDLFMMIY